VGVDDRGRLRNFYYCLPRALERVARAGGAFEGVLEGVAGAAIRAETRRPPGVSNSLASLSSGMPSGKLGSVAARFLAVAGVVATAPAAFADAGDAGGCFAAAARLAADFLGVAAAIAAATRGATEERRRLTRRGVVPNASVSLSVASLQPPASLAGDSG
jgi:hypothetical protein